VACETPDGSLYRSDRCGTEAREEIIDTLSCRETGSPTGECVLFLHAGSFSGTMWHDVAGRLPEFRCILPDLPGHGLSRDIELQSLTQASDRVATMIRERSGGGPVDLVGLSFGSYVGLLLMLRHPRLVGRAMLSGIHLGSIPNRVRTNLLIGLISPLFSFGWFRTRMAGSLQVSAHDILNRADGSANVSPQTLRTVMRLVSDFDLQDELPKIDVPTLVIAGAKEQATILDSLLDYRRSMPDCTARTVPEMGHAWCYQDPALFAETVRAWVGQAPLPHRLDVVEPDVARFEDGVTQ